MDVDHLLNGVRFVWDADKAVANAAKHRVTFAEACEVFFDPFVRPDADQVNGGEERYTVIGLTERWRLLCVVYVVRAESSFRIISARVATRSDRRIYEQQ